MQEYIQQQLEQKNRPIYFRNGRWLVHVLIWLGIYSFACIDKSQSPFSFYSLIYVLCVDLGLYIIAWFCYCRYLIPGYFKRGRLRAFWAIWIAAILVLPALDMLLGYAVGPVTPLAYKDVPAPGWTAYTELLGNTIITFFALSFVLYIMEIAEGIGTYRSVNTQAGQRLAAEQQMLRTRIQPGFMMQALDGLAVLAARKDAGTPDALIGFSDILRYRLYQREEKVLLADELLQLQQLFRFRKTVSAYADNAELAIAGEVTGSYIPSLTLINIATSLLSTDDGQGTWSLLLYLLAGEAELQITAELYAGNAYAPQTITELQQTLAAIFHMDCNFTSEQEENCFRINICIPTTR